MNRTLIVFHFLDFNAIYLDFDIETNKLLNGEDIELRLRKCYGKCYGISLGR